MMVDLTDPARAHFAMKIFSAEHDWLINKAVMAAWPDEMPVATQGALLDESSMNVAVRMYPAVNPGLSLNLLSNSLAPTSPSLALVQLPILAEPIILSQEEDDAIIWHDALDMAKC